MNQTDHIERAAREIAIVTPVAQDEVEDILETLVEAWQHGAKSYEIHAALLTIKKKAKGQIL